MILTRIRLTVGSLALFFVLFSAIGSARGVDLNAPAEKARPTIGSEIERGNSTIFLATRDVELADFLGFDDRVSNALNKERSSGNDTDAFYLGAYFEAWMDLNNRLTSVQSAYGVVADSEFAQAKTVESYRAFKKIRS
jgi:hypothetical protein